MLASHLQQKLTNLLKVSQSLDPHFDHSFLPPLPSNNSSIQVEPTEILTRQDTLLQEWIQQKDDSEATQWIHWVNYWRQAFFEQLLIRKQFEQGYQEMCKQVEQGMRNEVILKEDFKRYIDELQSNELQPLQDKVIQLQQHIDELQLKNNELENDKCTLQDKVIQLQQHIEELQQNNETEFHQQILVLKSQFESRIDQLQTKVAKHSEFIQQFSSRFDKDQFKVHLELVLKLKQIRGPNYKTKVNKWQELSNLTRQLLE